MARQPKPTAKASLSIYASRSHLHDASATDADQITDSSASQAPSTQPVSDLSSDYGQELQGSPSTPKTGSDTTNRNGIVTLRYDSSASKRVSRPDVDRNGVLAVENSPISEDRRSEDIPSTHTRALRTRKPTNKALELVASGSILFSSLNKANNITDMDEVGSQPTSPEPKIDLIDRGELPEGRDVHVGQEGRAVYVDHNTQLTTYPDPGLITVDGKEQADTPRSFDDMHEMIIISRIQKVSMNGTTRESNDRVEGVTAQNTHKPGGLERITCPIEGCGRQLLRQGLSRHRIEVHKLPPEDPVVRSPAYRCRFCAGSSRWVPWMNASKHYKINHPEISRPTEELFRQSIDSLPHMRSCKLLKTRNLSSDTAPRKALGNQHGIVDHDLSLTDICTPLGSDKQQDSVSTNKHALNVSPDDSSSFAIENSAGNECASLPSGVPVKLLPNTKSPLAPKASYPVSSPHNGGTAETRQKRPASKIAQGGSTKNSGAEIRSSLGSTEYQSSPVSKSVALELIQGPSSATKHRTTSITPAATTPLNQAKRRASTQTPLTPASTSRRVTRGDAKKSRYAKPGAEPCNTVVPETQNSNVGRSNEKHMDHRALLQDTESNPDRYSVPNPKSRACGLDCLDETDILIALTEIAIGEMSHNGSAKTAKLTASQLDSKFGQAALDNELARYCKCEEESKSQETGNGRKLLRPQYKNRLMH